MRGVDSAIEVLVKKGSFPAQKHRIDGICGGIEERPDCLWLNRNDSEALVFGSKGWTHGGIGTKVEYRRRSMSEYNISSLMAPVEGVYYRRLAGCQWC